MNSLSDISRVATRLGQLLKELEARHDKEGPAPAGCSEELLIPLRAARAEATRILLAE